MKSKTKTGLIVIGIGLLAFGAGYYFFVLQPSKKISTEEDAIQFLLLKGKSNEKSLRGFGAPFVISWANAINNSEPSFKVGNKQYSAQTGKAIN